MPRRRFRPLLLAAVLAAGAGAAEERAARPVPPLERGLPLIRTFLPRQYRAHDQIWAITETNEGLMLFANLDRVTEFDGSNWRNIEVPGGSYIRVMARDAAGTVFVGGVNEVGRLAPGPDGRLAYESLRHLVPAEAGDLGAFWCSHPRPDGLWLQANNALLRWNGAGFDTWRIESKTTALSHVCRDEIVVCTDRGWFTPRPGGAWRQLGGEQLGPWLPRFFVRGADGGWLVGTGMSGLRDFREDATFRPHPTGIDEWLKKSRPLSARQLPDGRIIIHSVQGGAVVLGPDLSFQLLLDEQTGLDTNTVITSHTDRRGVLWLGTDRGIARAALDSPVRVYDTRQGLPRSGTDTIERQVGRIIVSGNTGALELRPPENRPGFARFVPLEQTREKFTTFLRLSDGVLGGGLTGVFWIGGGQSVKIESPPGVREIVESRTQPGRFFGTHLHGFCSWRREGGAWIYEGDWEQVGGELRNVVPDPDGSIWTSTPTAGVLRITPAPEGARAVSVEKLGEAEGLPVKRRRVWLTEAGGAPLFQTAQGMFRYDAAARRFRPEGRYGAAGTRVRICSEDDRGGLWMIVENSDGVPVELGYGRDGRRQQVPLSDLNDMGLVNHMNWESWHGREILWIGSEGQLRQVDIARWRENQSAPIGRTLIREVADGDGRPRPAGGGPLQLRAGESTLRFAFGTPGLAGESEIRHETRLRGFKDGQIELGPAGTRTFTNLPAGSYTFEARGRTGDGRWSEPAVLAFTVLAPWWQTPGAIAGWVVFGGLLLFAYIRLRIRRLVRERSRLEDIVADRTAELARKNGELERLHRLDQGEKLAARLAEEKAHLELLRYQLNPHFLYNSLNSIRALVFTNAAAAGEMVTRLSEFCRWTLTRTVGGMTTVGEEVEMLQAYLDIERTRWQEGLRARIEMDETARAEPVPQFLFLPLLENAIKYGGKTSPGVLEVTLSVRREDGELLCEVANTGGWVKPARPAPGSGHAAGNGESTRIGLDNLRQRLARHYGPDCRPEVVTMPGWVCVRLRLPRDPKPPGPSAPP